MIVSPLSALIPVSIVLCVWALPRNDKAGSLTTHQLYPGAEICAAHDASARLGSPSAARRVP